MEELKPSVTRPEKDSEEHKPKPRRVRRGSTLINLAQVRARAEHQQKQPEREEAFNDSTIEVLLNSNSEMVIVIERKSLEVLAVNQAVEKFLEANYVDINTLYDFFSQETLAAIASKTQSIPYQVITTPEGKDFFVNIESTPIHWSGEDALLLKITGFDAELEASREEEYIQTQNNLKSRVETAEHLVGGTAHDMNNILTSIAGNLELLMDSLPTMYDFDVVGECVRDAIGSTRKGVHLTTQLLGFIRGQEINLKKADLNRYIRQLSRRLFKWQDDYGIEIRTIDDGNSCLCKFDPVQIYQVFLNLVSNARDAMPNGGTITVGVSNVTPENAQNDSIKKLIGDDRYVCLFIEDDGEGISEENMDKIFNLFFTKKSGSQTGSGIGLAVVKRIVEKHGGQIHVESKTGEDSCTKFYILLPKDI